MDILSQEQCLIECESEWPEITSQKNAKKNLEKQEIKTDSGSKQDCEGNATNTPLVTKTKHLEELISEINESNPRFEKSQLRDAFQFIESIYLSLRDVTLEFISAWANKVRNEEEYPSASEKIAFVWKAMELTSSHKIRSVQVLTVMMTYGSKQGEIAQVNTGEGKTIIIAMLTALLCLDDHKVDMVTTSPELAVPQSQQLEDFYKLLGLSSSNIDKGEKSYAYKCNVVYGSINEFEGDVLHDEFMKEGTRVERRFDIVIVDEADSMLVDGINNMTRLSSPMPGMNTLLPILIEIWDLFEKAEKATSSEKMEEAGKVNLQKEIDNFIRNSEEVERKVRDRIETNKLRVPKHLKEFVLEHQLSIWVQNANKARHHLTRDREYVIRDKEVKIVDLHNSGIVFKNMKWSDGLHQFLQIKNNVPLTCEDLVTNFIGNPTFFLKYEKIFGFTGTLGCSKTRIFLETSYKVGTMIIPAFKVKQHIRFSPIIVKSKDEWYRAIVGSCMAELRNLRVVLIIADSIAETDLIREQFLNYDFDANRILMYQTENDSDIAKPLIQPGHVIITTNICGRGVNIFPSPDAPGGLHICLTFLPENSRVEDQNIGRTSRSGNPGTSQIILLDSDRGTLDDINNRRDESNKAKLASMDKDMARAKAKADVFNKFCAFLNKIDKTDPTGTDWNVDENFSSGLQTEQLCDAIKEKFSIWLTTRKDENNPEDLLKQYAEFEKSIIATFETGKAVTENMFLIIRSGVKFMLNSEYPAAIEQFSKAIGIDENYSAFAYLNRAVSHVGINEYEKALVDLTKAETGTLALIEQLEKLALMAKSHSEELEKKFNRQIDFLEGTVESIKLVTSSDLQNKNTIRYAMDKHMEIQLIFVKWLDDFSANDETVNISDAIELVMRGWIGAVEIENCKKEMGSKKKLKKKPETEKQETRLKKLLGAGGQFVRGFFKTKVKDGVAVEANADTEIEETKLPFIFEKLEQFTPEELAAKIQNENPDESRARMPTRFSGASQQKIQMPAPRDRVLLSRSARRHHRLFSFSSKRRRKFCKRTIAGAKALEKTQMKAE